MFFFPSGGGDFLLSNSAGKISAVPTTEREVY